MQPDETIARYFYITGWICIAVFAALAAVIGVCGTQILTKVPPCPLHAYTGYYCPGCGGTRATFALLHGHLIRSFVLHPFVPYTAVFGGWFMLSQTLQRISRGRLHIGMHFRPLYMWLALAIIAVSYTHLDVYKRQCQYSLHSEYMHSSARCQSHFHRQPL